MIEMDHFKEKHLRKDSTRPAMEWYKDFKAAREMQLYCT
jgi:hypothetical protein